MEVMRAKDMHELSELLVKVSMLATHIHIVSGEQ